MATATALDKMAASKTAHLYYASKLSEKTAKTPEGFLLCVDAVIGRTGWQTYAIGEIPRELAMEIGLNPDNPTEQVNLYRSPDQIFSNETIASFEGKPVTFDHPSDGFVVPENFREYSCGHAQNVRKGSESLESGDWPLIADLLITTEPLISLIEAHDLRELSCGYNYRIEKIGDKLAQVGIVGNHIAVVRKGRAGAEARIQDAALETPVAAVAGETVVNRKKEKKQMGATNMLMRVFGRGLQHMAADKDCDAEDLAMAAKDLATLQIKKLPPPEGQVSDAEEEEEEKGGRPFNDRKVAAANDRRGRAKDRRAADDTEAPDMADARSRMHATLDEMITARNKSTSDADIAALKDLFADYLNEEQGEPEHLADQPPPELMNKEEEEPVADEDPAEAILPEEPAADEFPPKEEGEEEEEAEDTEEAPGETVKPVGEVGEQEVVAADAMLNKVVLMIGPACTKTKDIRVRNTFDSAPINNPTGLLKYMRPAVARTTDNTVRKAFDAAVQEIRRGGSDSGGYSRFAKAAGTSVAHDSPRPQEDYSDLTAYYRAAKGKNPSEVKL